MTETGPRDGRFIHRRSQTALPEDHPFKALDISRSTGLSPSTIQYIMRPRVGQEPLVQPVRVKINHVPTNIFSPEDRDVFARIQELIQTGFTIGEAMKSLREERLKEQSESLSSFMPGG